MSSLSLRKVDYYVKSRCDFKKGIYSIKCVGAIYSHVNPERLKKTLALPGLKRFETTALTEEYRQRVRPVQNRRQQISCPDIVRDPVSPSADVVSTRRKQGSFAMPSNKSIKDQKFPIFNIFISGFCKNAAFHDHIFSCYKKLSIDDYFYSPSLSILVHFKQSHGWADSSR